jgi:hypothetical protein
MIACIRRFALTSLAAAVAALLSVAPLGAQQVVSTADDPTGGRRRAEPAGPTVERAAAGARRLTQQPASLEEAEAAMQQRLGLGQARALMIVGFSAVVIGLLMEDDAGDLIAIGGAIVGLYGLYHYLR